MKIDAATFEGNITKFEKQLTRPPHKQALLRNTNMKKQKQKKDFLRRNILLTNALVILLNVIEELSLLLIMNQKILSKATIL